MSIGSGTNQASHMSGKTYIHTCFPVNETVMNDPDKITVPDDDLELLIALRPFVMSLFVRSESTCDYHNPGCCDFHDELRAAKPRSSTALAMLYDMRLLRTEQQGPIDPEQLIRYLDQVIKDSKAKSGDIRFDQMYKWTRTFAPANGPSPYQISTTGTLKNQPKPPYKLPSTFTFTYKNSASRES